MRGYFDYHSTGPRQMLGGSVHVLPTRWCCKQECKFNRNRQVCPCERRAMKNSFPLFIQQRIFDISVCGDDFIFLLRFLIPGSLLPQLFLSLSVFHFSYISKSLLSPSQYVVVVAFPLFSPLLLLIHVFLFPSKFSSLSPTFRFHLTPPHIFTVSPLT